jgi:hypothetical protein
MNTMNRRAKDINPRRVSGRFHFRDWSIEMMVCLLAASVSLSFAGYTVNSQVQTGAGVNHYTWTVQNQDQDWGLDQFAVDVPVETRVLAHTVPPPYANPDGTAYWVMLETREAQVDPHDGKAWLPAAPPGRKWLIWAGQQSPSVYPPKATATFSLTTDAIVKPGVVNGTAATYTPQNNPSYYSPFHGEVIGPATIVTDATNYELTSTSILTTDAQFQSGPSAEPGVIGNSEKTMSTARLSIGLYAGVAIEGVIGQTYGIQYNTDLSNPAGWLGLANVTVVGAKQIWFDTQSATQSQRYYRILRGPTSIP